MTTDKHTKRNILQYKVNRSVYIFAIQAYEHYTLSLVRKEGLWK